jgi:hypothetical protein
VGGAGLQQSLHPNSSCILPGAFSFAFLLVRAEFCSACNRLCIFIAFASKFDQKPKSQKNRVSVKWEFYG